MSFPYPPEIASRIKPSPKREAAVPTATGRAADFLCGVSAEFEVVIDSDQGVIKNVYYSTNGCGYVVAAAHVIAEILTGRRLVDLKALELLDAAITTELGRITGDRRHCINICFDAVQGALSEYRGKQVDEWSGEEALICSCFGISETRIESLTGEASLVTVESIGEACKAGTGCGSCQHLIQEMIDSSL